MKSFRKEHQLPLLKVLLVFFFSHFADGDEGLRSWSELPKQKIYKFEDTSKIDEKMQYYPEGDECRVWKFRGVCKRWSQCEIRSPKYCHGARDPIVCCLDNIVSKPGLPKPEVGEYSFPGCGLRSPVLKSAVIQWRKSLGTREGFVNDAKNINATMDLKSLVMGGKEAVKNSWPWMASISLRSLYVCGGSLISRQYVLTAAHCFTNSRNPADYSVLLGSHTGMDGIKYHVEEVIPYPDFLMKQTVYNDIALVKLRDAVELTKAIYPVCLPTDALRKKHLPPVVSRVTLTGWGYTNHEDIPSDALMEITIPVVDHFSCKEYFKQMMKHGFFEQVIPEGIMETHICAGGIEPGRNGCKGDSGSPIVIELDDNSYVAVGVASFGGMVCGTRLPTSPSVFTKVSAYMDFIYDNSDIVKPEEKYKIQRGK